MADGDRGGRAPSLSSSQTNRSRMQASQLNSNRSAIPKSKRRRRRRSGGIANQTAKSGKPRSIRY